MNKILLSAAVAAALASQAAFAQDNDYSNPMNDFFVAGNLGQSQYRAGMTHNDGVFQNVRFGWRWNGIVGPEIGYAYLGRPKNVYDFGGDAFKNSIESRAVTLGVNGKYNFYQNWFVTAHLGYLRSEQRNRFTDYTFGTRDRFDSWNNGWYGGVGVGYDVTHNVSVGVNYDNYHLQDRGPGINDHVNVAAYSASVEYRF